MSSDEQDRLNDAMNDGMDDAGMEEFDAFLNGRGQLARQLAALPQPAAPAALDAAILAAVAADLARAAAVAAVAAYPAAANDALVGTAPTRRWRLPAGLAASVAGVTGAVWLAWQTQITPVPQAQEPAAAAASVSAAPAAAAPVSAAPVSAAPEVAAPGAAKVLTRDSAPTAGNVWQSEPPRAVEAKQAPAQAPRSAPLAEAGAPALAAQSSDESDGRPGQLMAKPARPPPPAAPAPAAPLAYAPAGNPASLGDSLDRTLDSRVSGRLDRSRNAASAAPDARATAWLAVIDDMLKAGLRQDALDEWRRFRLAYPDYPVPDALAARIQALQ